MHRPPRAVVVATRVLVGLVAAGAGVGFVTAGVAAAARPGVTYRPVADAPSLPVAAAWLGEQPIPTAARFLKLVTGQPLTG